MLKGVVFAGGKELGAKCLNYLIAHMINVCAVLCREDEYGSFSKNETVCTISQRYGIPFFVDEQSLIEADIHAQYGLCVMYPRKLSDKMLELPQCGFYNFHGAPLPQYRGCTGHIWAILNGETQYGVTSHRMTAEFDRGPILKALQFPICPDETGITLHAKAVDMTFRLFCDTVTLLSSTENVESMLTPQDESKAAYYGKTIPNGAEILWNQHAAEIDKFIRALLFHGVLPPFTRHEGEKIHVSAISILRQTTSEQPGKILGIDAEGIVVATEDNAVSIAFSQMHADDGVLGKLREGAVLGN